MNLIHEAVKKAQKEGKIGHELLPWTEITANQNKKTEDIGESQNLIDRSMEIAGEMAEDTRKIVENIHSVILQTGARVIGFTSALPEEGTSTIAAVVSSTLANKLTSKDPESVIFSLNENETENSDKQGVVLVDAQLRNPSIHKIFGEINDLGLTDLLKKELTFNSVLKKAAKTKLKFITSGSQNYEQSYLKYQKELEDVLSTAKQNFELVCVDLPSLLNYSEGILLSRLCDGIILVIRAGQTSLEDIEDAKGKLEAAGANIFGSILNKQGTIIPASLSKLL